jgi:small subunit ribosomal protein S7e
MSKVVKQKGVSATALENNVAKVISEIQIAEVAEEVKQLSITAVKEVQVTKGKKALVIFVPFRQHRKFQKIQKRLIVEVEKKFPNTHVLVIAQRTILSDNMARWTNQKLPHSRTLAAVQEAILTDVVSPSIIVGKRIRFKTDGSQVLKVFVDKKDTKDVEEKLATFAAVYKRLTSRAVEFSFQ